MTIDVDGQTVVVTVRGQLPPPVLKAPAVAQLYDISVDHLYELVRNGEAPVAPRRLGRSLRWVTAEVLADLGIAPPERDEASGTAPGGFVNSVPMSAAKHNGRDCDAG